MADVGSVNVTINLNDSASALLRMTEAIDALCEDELIPWTASMDELIAAFNELKSIATVRNN